MSVTLDQIVNTHLQMLEQQEAALLKSLSLVRQARELFEQSLSTSVPLERATGKRKRGRRKKSSAAQPAAPKKSRSRKRRTRTPGKHIDRILALLKDKKSGMSSGEIIETLFKNQSADKDKKHFSTLIYPTLTRAYKTKMLVNKNNKVMVS